MDLHLSHKAHDLVYKPLKREAETPLRWDDDSWVAKGCGGPLISLMSPRREEAGLGGSSSRGAGRRRPPPEAKEGATLFLPPN